MRCSKNGLAVPPLNICTDKFGQRLCKNLCILMLDVEEVLAHHPSIHPSIVFRLSDVGSRGQQPKQRDPDFSLPSHLGQLVRGNPKAFPGQLRNIVPPASPGSSSGPPPGGMCL
ncbi:hypothetical protein ILYODFUR_019254 [Ilyodon furcidens]|uniref:Uncharacterized protein n=1 Tax=Ilyodon furcidens TaxID=33524 RepID=A0ABV0SZQ0_9TELE